MPVNMPITNLNYYGSKTASSQVRCPAPALAKSFLPKYSIENLVAEIENPIEVKMDIQAGKHKQDYVVCAYNSKLSNNKPVKIGPYEEKIRFLAGRDYDALAFYVNESGSLESAATIYRQIEGGREVAYVYFDSKYMGGLSSSGTNLLLRFNYWNFSLIKKTAFTVLFRGAEKNGLLNPPDSKQDSQETLKQKSIIFNEFSGSQKKPKVLKRG